MKRKKERERGWCKGIHFTVDVEDVVELDLEVAQLLRGDRAVAQRRVVLVAPRRAVRVAVTVVVAQQVVALGGVVVGDLQRLVHRRQQVVHQVGHEVDHPGEVVLHRRGRQSAEQVQCAVELVSHLGGAAHT